MNNNIKYKNTNLQWLPQIPEHWEVRKLKYISKLQSGFAFKSSDFSDNGIPVFRIGDVNEEYSIEECPKFPKSKPQPSKDFIVENKDILIALTGATIGRVAEISIDGFGYLNQRVAKLKSKDKFLYYCLNSKFIQEQIKLVCYGSAQENISNTDIENFYFPFPTINYQLSTVNFLDAKTTKINHFITQKQNLIALLKEQRQSIINSVVSGQWIIENGKLVKPKKTDEWITKRLKFIADVKFSNVDKHSHKDEIPVRLCNYTDVYKNDYIVNNMEFMLATCTKQEIEKFKVQKGDIIITKDSETANDIAVPAFVAEQLENVVCGYHLAQIRADEAQILSEFLFRKFQSKELNAYLEVEATGVTRVGLSIGDITSILVSFPKSLSMQQAMINYIKTETQAIDQAIAKTNREIELIKEYKEALISEAVTGKLILN